MQPKQKGIVHFDSQPRGADIIVDGQIFTDPDTEESVKTPATVSLYEGRHDFILRLHGSEDATGYVDVYAGSRVDIFRNFKPGTPGGGEQPEPQMWLSNQNMGMIRIHSTPYGAEIYIDENPVKDQSGNIVTTPIRVIDIPEGDHQITFRMPGYLEETKTVRVYPGRWSDITTTMRPDYSKYA
jgi:hypothetical protein